MFRGFYVLLTISGLLACPFNCALKAANSHNKSAVLSSHCHCCKVKCFADRICLPTSQQSNSPTDEPSQDDKCADCVCTAAADPSNLRIAVPDFAPVQENVSERIDLSHDLSSAKIEWSNNQLYSPKGLTLRIALHSFLI